MRRLDMTGLAGLIIEDGEAVRCCVGRRVYFQFIEVSMPSHP